MHAPLVSTRSSTLGMLVGVTLSLAAGGALAQAKAGAKPLAGEVVKMAWIDPLSGLMAPVGNNQLKSWQFFAEKFNATNPAGVKFEIIGIDNKLSPTESLNALKSATDQGVRYIIQGNGSSVALALILFDGGLKTRFQSIRTVLAPSVFFGQAIDSLSIHPRPFPAERFSE